MPPVGAERWFHTLVVVGASLTGCGGATSDTGTLATSGSGGASSTGGAASKGMAGGGLGGAAFIGASMCAYAGQFVCDDYITLTNCRCDPTAPRQMTDCESRLDYQCTKVPCHAPPGSICIGNDYVGCRCDPSGPRPSDCATPEQFSCKDVEPFYSGCTCVPSEPPTSCSNPNSFCCQSYDPQFGCSCGCVGIK
jgi:hypothetical protein